MTAEESKVRAEFIRQYGRERGEQMFKRWKGKR